MSPRFSRSRALPASADPDQAGRVPGYPVRMSIVPLGLMALLGGLILAATYLVPGPEQEEPESLTHVTLRGHRDQVNAVAFAPDGRALASGSEDHTAVLWAVATSRREAMTLEHEAPVYAVAFSPDGRTLASGGLDAIVRLWDTTTGKQRAMLKGHTEGVRALAFAPDGATLASGGSDGNIKLWHPATGRARSTLRGHTGIVSALAFAPDCRTLASG
jgi:WD40 repeat protein